MTTPIHEVLLFVGPTALRVDVWDRYDISLSMLQAGNPWTFSFWHSDVAHSTWDVLLGPDGPKDGDLVTMTIDGDAVLSGFVEVRRVGDASDSGRPGMAMILSGRDRAGRAVSFDADPTLALRGRPLDEALTRVMAGVGLTVEVSESVDPTATTGNLRVPHTAHARKASRHQSLDLAHPHVGEKVWQVVERLVRRLGYRAWVTTGSQIGITPLIVDVPKSSGSPLFTFQRIFENGAVTDDSNIETGYLQTSIRDVPTQVTTYGDAMRGDNTAARLARTVANGNLLSDDVTHGEVADLGTSQPRYIRSETARSNEAAQAESARTIADAMERFRGYHLTTRGHGQAGMIYCPNTRCAVRDDFTRVNETMLMTEVTLSGGRQVGQRSRVTLVPDGAISTTPVPA